MSAEPRIEIVTYRAGLREAFERLNRVWLEGHSLLEQADIDCLLDPETHVLATGGEVFFAMDQGEVLGTCAAIRVPPSTVELAKLAVSPGARGRGSRSPERASPGGPASGRPSARSRRGPFDTRAFADLGCFGGVPRRYMA